MTAEPKDNWDDIIKGWRAESPRVTTGVLAPAFEALATGKSGVPNRDPAHELDAKLLLGGDGAALEARAANLGLPSTFYAHMAASVPFIESERWRHMVARRRASGSLRRMPSFYALSARLSEWPHKFWANGTYFWSGFAWVFGITSRKQKRRGNPGVLLFIVCVMKRFSS